MATQLQVHRVTEIKVQDTRRHGGSCSRTFVFVDDVGTKMEVTAFGHDNLQTNLLLSYSTSKIDDEAVPYGAFGCEDESPTAECLVPVVMGGVG